MSLLARAMAGASRRQLLAEISRVWAGKGLYAASQDEQTRPGEDLPSLVPAAFLMIRLLGRPGAAKKIIDHAVKNYALSEEAVRLIEGLGEQKTYRTSAA
jgi:hypothetical protein